MNNNNLIPNEPRYEGRALRENPGEAHCAEAT